VSPAPRFPAGPTIVVADQSPTLLDFMVATLRSASCCVYQEYDGLAALELVLGLRNIDLLITNIRMSGIEGPQLIRQVREKMPTLPILYIANRELPAGKVPDELPPDVRTLREPFTGAELLVAARALLDRRP
jgi:CheY-like chemotaxis protein